MNYWNKSKYKSSFSLARNYTKYYSRSFFASASMLPRAKRWATFALYGFSRYVDNLIDLPRHRSNSELIREINALRDELRIAYRSGESEHPIIQPFILTAKKYNIPEEYPQQLLLGVEMDLQHKYYENFDDLYVFCYRVAGVVGLMMTHVLGFNNKEALFYAEKLGIAMQLTNILRDVQEDKNMGRIYIPADEIEKFGLTFPDINSERWNTAMQNLMKFQVERAMKYYKEAQPGIPLLEKSSRFAVSSAARIYEGILLKIIERDYNPFEGRVIVSQREKISILFEEYLRTRLKPNKVHKSKTQPFSEKSFQDHQPPLYYSIPALNKISAEN